MSSYIIKILFLSIKNTSPQNQIFQANSSLFQSIGRPALGGQSTDMHNRAQNWASGRPVHRPVDRLGDLELTWSSSSVRSTGSRPVPDRPCKAQSTGSRPVDSGAHALWPVDWQSTDTLPPLKTPVDRQSTGGRPIG